MSPEEHKLIREIEDYEDEWEGWDDLDKFERLEEEIMDAFFSGDLDLAKEKSKTLLDAAEKFKD